MVRLRNYIVLVLLLVNFIYCEHETSSSICIYTEGGKVCGSGESVEFEDVVSVEGSDVNIQTRADDVIVTGSVAEEPSANIDGSYNATITDSGISNADTSNNSGIAETNAVNISNTDSNAVSAKSGIVRKSDDSTSNLIATNTRIHEPSDSPAETNISMEGSASIIDEVNTSKQEHSTGVEESNKNTKGDSAEAVEVNSIKKKNSSSVAEANSTLQESPAVSAELSANIEDSSAVASERNKMQESSDILAGPSTSALSNATTGIQNSEQAVKTNQTLENVAEELSPAEAVAVAEGMEAPDAILQMAGAESGERETSQSEESTSNIDPAESVALAEAVVMAGAILQMVTATPPPANTLSDAGVVALAEGLEMAEAVLQAARQDEPAVNAIWKATLEAESTWRQDDVPENQETLDKGLLSFLVCVMIVLTITGSVSGWVLFTRLRRTPEEDQPPNMYILVDNYDSTFVDCPLDVNDSEGVSYVFPGVGNQTSP